uniref:Claspin n=1 Tax=Photinus pyralis TaxID=7054 RepID=A0A1Y1KHU8_PHOPY
MSDFKMQELNTEESLPMDHSTDAPSEENNPNVINVEVSNGVNKLIEKEGNDVCPAVDVEHKQYDNENGPINNASNNVHVDGSVARKSRISKKLRRIAIADSDSETDTVDTVLRNSDEENSSKVEDIDEKSLSQNEVVENSIKKRRAIIDSDSDETESVDHKETSRSKLIIDSDSDGETFNTNNVHTDTVEGSALFDTSRIAALCDSESSEDEREMAYSENIKSMQNTKKKSVVRPKKERPPKRMTAKDAIKQRQEIASESQRMLREMPLALPYHRPKERSMEEFFKNRPRLSIIKKKPNLPVSAAMKMTTEEFKAVVKEMEDREKEVEKFYKSDSEEEQEENIALASVDDNIDNENHHTPEKTDSVTPPTATISNPADDCVNLPNNLSQSNDCDNVNETETINMKTVEEAHKDCVGVVEVDECMSTTQDFFENNCINDENKEDSKVVEDLVMETSQTHSDMNDSTEARSEDCEVNPCEEREKGDSDHSIAHDLENLSCEHPVQNDTCAPSVQNKIIIHSIVTIPNVTNATEESVDYDFNLDGLDENIENGEDARLQTLINKYASTDAKCDSNQKMTFKQQLFKELGNRRPALSGDPDQEIDFDDGIMRPNPVCQLKDRFMKLQAPRKAKRETMKLDIVNLSQGEVQKEIVTITVDDNKESEMPSKPGVRLQMLRNELQEKIAKEKAETWKNKDVTLSQLDENADDMGETSCKDGYEADEEILDDEEEEEETDEETDDEIEQVEKVRKKSAFVDDEAEVTDEDECDDASSGRSSKMSVQVDEDNSNTGEGLPEPKKRTSRILKGFAEDSDNDSVDDLKPSVKVADTCNIETESVSDVWDDHSSIPPHQPIPDKTPQKPMTQPNTDSSFYTPVMQLTALQGLNSGSKFLHESPISPFRFSSATPSQSVEGARQKLFVDNCDTAQVEDLDDIAELCSGKFPSTNDTTVVELPQPTTQDLLEICSGSFTGLTNSKLNNQCDSIEQCKKLESPVEEPDTVDLPNQDSSNPDAESRYLDEDRIISQLLNEEELAQFKKKFESPVADQGSVDIQGGGKLVFDSSDDEFSESNPKVTKTHHKKLQFSDDESEEDNDNDEEIDLYDDNSDADEGKMEILNEEINYDSEENEVDQSSVHKQRSAPGDFLEKEAELTESEWDSADEDERDLDILEAEQGDTEVFDENKIRNDLEKIHMRRVLDDDQREIKILQEMLLEDGELHGTGRERQFRWRNIDDNANDDRGPKDEDDVYLEEDESEEQWRRARHQREMFLKSQEQNGVDDLDSDILSNNDSQVFKIGQEAFQRSLSHDKNTSTDLHSKTSFFSNTRGSFLSRTDRFLTRLAGMTKVTSTVNVVKTSKKIVFHTTSFTSENEDKSNNKRKASDGTPVAIKKLRLTSNFSPSISTRDQKTKLF